ncbi:MAG TPA: HAD-IIIC family phosphatase [Candidatus Acidoferrales bacterium]|nr:HAD-IIIC family phosphatase [Candidatus Acidoferrales bacterium]
MPLLNSIEEEIRAAPSVRRADLLQLSEPPGLREVRVQVHRNYAFELVGSVVGPFLWLSGLRPVFVYGDYDDSLSFSNVNPDAVQMIALDFDRYGEKPGTKEFGEWFAGRLRNLRSKTDKPIIVCNWASVDGRAEKFNRDLERIAERLPSAFTWNVAGILQEMGDRFFDERTTVTGTRLSNSASIEMGRNLGLVRLPSALLPRIKAVAVDLDNTLYDGVLGEDGASGIRISAGHQAVHQELLRLRGEGVFLAVLSKNDERDFAELCEKRADFQIKETEFSARSIGWHSKADGLRKIAEQLRIGTDAILVVDDNLGEISQLRAACPDTPLLHSQNPEQTLFWLRHYPALNGYRAHGATALRLNDLDASRERELLRATTTEADYVREMQIELTYALNPMSLCGRLAELSRKTNQFNTGLRRFSEVEVARSLEAPEHFTIAIGMRDRFCDSGIIGAVFARKDGDALLIDEVAISCRALGRTVESPMIALALAPILEEHRLQDVAFRFREGPRNLPARMWLAAFTGAKEINDGSIIRISWEEVPQREEHVKASVTARWENLAG